MTHDSIFPFACVTHGNAISPFFVEKITKIFGKKEEEPNSSYQINQQKNKNF